MNFTAVGSLTAAVCRMLTSDILLSTGSSLVIIGAFAPRNSPVIFEEERKQLDNEKFRRTHIFSDEEVVRMFEGEISHPMQELKAMLHSALEYKFK